MNESVTSMPGERMRQEEECCLACFVKIDKVYQKLCSQSVSEYGFTPNEIVVMMFLANNEGLKSASEIAQYRNISKGLIARSVDSLCEKGYITADRDKNDRRLVRLKLTEKSIEIVEQIRRCRKDFVEELHRGIPEEDLKILHRTASIMNQNVESLLNKTTVKTDNLTG